MNVNHFANILRQCAAAGQWEASFSVLAQMKREAIRPDVAAVGSVLVSCSSARPNPQWEACLKVFQHYQSEVGLKLDSTCYLAVQKACVASNRHSVALQLHAVQEKDRVPMLPANIESYIDAAEAEHDEELVLQLVERLPKGYSHPRRMLVADADEGKSAERLQ